MIYAYATLQVTLFMICLAGLFQAKKFIGSHSAISDRRDLERYKSFVRLNMYGALLTMALTIPAVLISIYLSFAYDWLGMAAVIGVNAPLFLLSRYLRSFELKTRQLECDVDLSSQYRMISEAWEKKALPNF